MVSSAHFARLRVERACSRVWKLADCCRSSHCRLQDSRVILQVRLDTPACFVAVFINFVCAACRSTLRMMLPAAAFTSISMDACAARRPALRMMHALLLANVDTLALDANPASQLPSPSLIGPDIRIQKAVLAWFMSLMAEVRVGVGVGKVRVLASVP